VLVIDIGGTNVKFLASGHKLRRHFPSGPKLTPQRLVAEVKRLTRDWKYDVISIGYPGLVRDEHIIEEPRNLGPGWVGFDFERAFRRPVRLINDAAMQALGSYRGGLMLFLGLGTGLGSAFIANGVIISLGLGGLAYKQGTYEGYVGLRGFKRLGKKKWQKHVIDIVERFVSAVHADEAVIGGGQAKKLTKLPAGCRVGDNAYAFVGGFRLWAIPPYSPDLSSKGQPRLHQRTI
jgi:polyphosphate glucokinase